MKNRFSKLQSGEESFTLVLDDPAGNSYLQNLYAPDPDPNMTIEVKIWVCVALIFPMQGVFMIDYFFRTSVRPF